MRFSQAIDFYNSQERSTNLERALKQQTNNFPGIMYLTLSRLNKILGYCIMPDHYHLLIKVLVENSVSQFISNIQNSYTRYFNNKYNRKGPLWQSRFRCVQIKNNNQLLHVLRYIHLNPTTNNLTSKPEEWAFSSYSEYITDTNLLKRNHEISIQNNISLKDFTQNQIGYQRELRKIRKLIFK